ncbi:family 43 glycosylhydrolase [Streptomyces glaucosporus]|uniref:Family 43 glycosylhydrolase n=1 Tax=Streptomyces glaucosporus TaxID=284044 RepID=A0ABP5W0E0_9ACTN
MNTDRLPDAPLFRDPRLDGAADPTVVLHRGTGQAWMFYTARRATFRGEGVAWVHGTDIGIAVSDDGGASWRYRGVARGLEHEPGRNTYWAPEVVWHDGLYHMYVTYLRGVRTAWTGPRNILHYTSADLENWRFASVLPLPGDRTIDACVHPLPGGGWRMWFKDEADGSRIHCADSPDLRDWEALGRALPDDRPQEGPTVLRLGDSYWMLTDGWSGLLVHRSDDLAAWTPQPGALLAGGGARPDDEGPGHHAMALPRGRGDSAVLFYFTSPGGGQRSTVQAAALAVRGGRLVCDRDAPFSVGLRPGAVPVWRGGTAAD